MSRVIRVLCCAAIGVFLLLLPATSSAASPSPSPSPALETVIAAPPTGYTAITSDGVVLGRFTAHDWAVTASGASPTETETTLKNLGFVDGFAKAWSSASARRAIVEIVMAFSGGGGAKRALDALQKTDKADTHYQHPNTITGIGNYYGAHFTPANGTFEDEFTFTKGNDLFLVLAVGAKDDVLTVATDQATSQFNGAPAETIPSSQWPENAQHSPAFQVGYVIGALIPIVLIAGLVVLLVVLVRRRQRPGQVPLGAYSTAGAPAAVQMSDDGKFWWDGQTWRDADHEPPPFAQRSSDGSLWWDGRTWRPVPPPQTPSA